MPELAEVAFACRQWDGGIGKFVKSVYANPHSRVFRELSQIDVINRLSGAKLSSSSTHGKQMLFKFSGNLWLGIHLGMTGNLLTDQPSYLHQKHDALVLYQNKQSLIFKDPRKFGRVRLHTGKTAPLWWAELPLSMLDSKFNISILKNALLKHGKKPVKALLLDQRYFQGMGNWMADEVLWRARIHPALRCGKISTKESNSLFKEIAMVIKGAMKSVGNHGGDPPKNWLFHVRWKDGGRCPVSGDLLVREDVGGRTSCWCPKLQKLRT
jgi:formamidopyrimidine-DNA glycosylase